jgi:VanZ family protein
VRILGHARVAAEKVVDEADREHIGEDSEMEEPGVGQARKRIAAWAAVALWTGLILLLSTDSFSAEQSSRFIEPLLSYLFPGLAASERAAVHWLIRKSAHAFEYGALALLTWRALRVRPPGQELRSALLAMAFVASVACLDELGQSTRAARTGSVNDVLLDTAGGAAGLGVALALRATRRRRGRLSFPTAPVP